MVEDYRNQLVWQHGGNTPGMTTAVGMMPEKKFGVVVLSSMQSAALPDLLRQYIFDRELGAPMRDLSAEAYTRTLAQRHRADSVEKVQQAGHPLNATAATAAHRLHRNVRRQPLWRRVVSIKDGQASSSFAANGAVRCSIGTPTNFRWLIPPGSPTGPMNIKFEISPDNTVTGLYFGIGGDITLLGRKGGRQGEGEGRALRVEG